MNEQQQSKPPSAKRIVSVLAWLFIVGAAGSLSASIWGLAIVALALIGCVAAVVHKPTRDKVPLKWSVSLALGLAAAAYTGGSIHYAAYQERAAAEQNEEQFQSALADANKFIEQKQYADAIKSFESALAIRKPTAAEAQPLFGPYLNAAIDYIGDGNLKQAKATINRTLDLWPNHVAESDGLKIRPEGVAAQIDALTQIQSALALDAAKQPDRIVGLLSDAIAKIDSLEVEFKAGTITETGRRRLAELAPVVADRSLAAAEQQIKNQEFEEAIESASKAADLYDVSGDTAKKQRAQSLVATATKNLEAARAAEAERERQATEDAAREERIKRQFSGWDGSHRNLEKLIKTALNDPDSYDHVETNVWDNKRSIRIKTKYRANNAFGAKVLNCVTADYSIDGELIKIVEEGLCDW